MAVGMDFDLDLLSGRHCGVSGVGKRMSVNCVGLFLSALYPYCGILSRE